MERHLDKLLARFPVLESCRKDIALAFKLLKQLYEKDGILYVAGNGGSAADAEHIVGELMKGFLLERRIDQKDRNLFKEHDSGDGEMLSGSLQKGLRAYSLISHPALSTAFANDEHPENVFAQQLYVMGRTGDAFLAISTSGNSRNITQAVTVAKVKNIATIALTGRHGGRLAALCDCAIKVPTDITHEIQELHLPIYHTLCVMLEEYFYGD